MPLDSPPLPAAPAGPSFVPAETVINAAQPEDQPAILALLQANQLPTADLPTAAGLYLLVARHGGRVAAVAGVQCVGAAGLLRSVATDRDFRRRGLAAHLVRAVEAQAAVRGVQQLYLLTDTAAAYFAARGYQPAARAGAPPEVRATAEFARLCPENAVCLVKTLAR